jgi:predicted Na+-dependent transporter
VLLPSIFIHFRPLVPWLFSILTLSGSLNLKVRDIGKTLTNPLPILIFFVSTHVALPLMVYLVGSLVLAGEHSLISGFILLFSVPTAVSGFIWISIYRGDSALTLTVILLDTLLAPLVVPGTVSILLGTNISLDTGGMILSLSLMIVFPTIIGVLVNECSKGKIPRLVTPYMAPLSKFLLMMVIAANTSTIASRIDIKNPRLWIIAALGLLFTFSGYFLGFLSGRLGRFNNEKRISIFYAVSLRNISSAATLAISYFPAEAALPAVLGILFQQAMAALMGRLFLGKPGEPRGSKS